MYIALDTETIRGKAALLSTATDVYQIRSFDDFYERVKNLGRRFVFYNLDYDFLALMKLLDDEKCLTDIYLHGRGRSDLYSFQYIGGKYWSIKHAKEPALEIFDIMPFFQTSLDNAAKKYLGIGKRKIDAGLLNNLTWGKIYKHWDKVSEYARVDAELTQKLSDKLVQGLRAVNLENEKLYSPGFIAKKWYQKRGVKPVKLDREIDQFARKSYFGGRIEVWRRGYLKNVHIYDLKSAYPAAISQLPDLSQARFWYSQKPESMQYIAQVKIASKKIGVHPVRRDGMLYFPTLENVRRWVTSYELEVMQKNGVDVQFERTLNFESYNPEPIFSNLVNELFIKRKNSGFDSIVYKLILNSGYGIFAETVKQYAEIPVESAYQRLSRTYLKEEFANFLRLQSGRCENSWQYWNCGCSTCLAIRRLRKSLRGGRGEAVFSAGNRFYKKRVRSGKFHNIVYASLITGWCRAELLKVMFRYPSAIVGCFTDSIVADRPLAIEGDGLGKWEKQYSGKIYIVGSGVYQTDAETKTRGFFWRKKLTPIIRKSKSTRVYIPQNVRESLGIVLRQGVEIADLNVIRPDEKLLDLNFDQKRVWERDFLSGADFLQNCIKSRPFHKKQK